MPFVLWTGTRILTRGGEGDATAPTAPTHNTLMRPARETVQMETQLPGRESRAMIIAGPNTVKGCQKLCAETTALRQYLERIPGAELLKWAVEAVLISKLKNMILCFKTEKEDQ